MLFESWVEESSKNETKQREKSSWARKTVWRLWGEGGRGYGGKQKWKNTVKIKFLSTNVLKNLECTKI